MFGNLYQDYYVNFFQNQIEVGPKCKKGQSQIFNKTDGALVQKFIAKKPTQTKRLLVLSFVWHLLLRVNDFPRLLINKHYGRLHSHAIYLNPSNWFNIFSFFLWKYLSQLDELDYTRNVVVSANAKQFTWLNFYMFEQVDFLFGWYPAYFMRKFILFNNQDSLSLFRFLELPDKRKDFDFRKELYSEL